MEKQELQQLFSAYLEKKASPDEIKLLVDYFSLENESASLKEMIIQEMESTVVSNDVRNINEERVYSRVEQAINSMIDSEFEVPVIPIYRTILFKTIASIAAILLVVSGLYFWHQFLPVEIKTVYAAYGKRIEVDLPDSSKVWLNSGTTLQYPVAFNGDQRKVILKDGEAYFEVVHDADKSFIVTANGAKVSVLGTSFEISALNTESKTSVTVRTGKVGVLQTAIDQNATFLLPGERLTINKANHQVIKTKVDTADIAAWLHEQLIFSDAPIAEVFARLERNYDIHFNVEDGAVLDERITMRLNHQPLENVLSAISFSNHLTFRKINERIVSVNK